MHLKHLIAGTLLTLTLLPGASAAPEALAERAFWTEIGRAVQALKTWSADHLMRYKLVWTGKRYACRNGLGEEGHNKITVKELKTSRQGECGDLKEADLRGSHLSFANLRGANLETAWFHGAYLVRAEMEGAVLKGAFLPGARMAMANLRGSVLESAHLEGAHLAAANLLLGEMKGANLSAASLVAGQLSGANLTSAVLDGADLRGAYLIGASLVGAGLRGADLRGADLSQAMAFLADFRKAKYDKNTKLPFDDEEATRRGMIRVE